MRGRSLFPPRIAAELGAYLDVTTGVGKSPLFPRADGGAITGNALGHAGLTMAAQGGATMRELMARGGHRTARAALIYQQSQRSGMHLLRRRWTSSPEPRWSPVRAGRVSGLEAVIRLEMPGL